MVDAGDAAGKIIICSQLQARLNTAMGRPVLPRVTPQAILTRYSASCRAQPARSPRPRESDRLGAADANISFEPWIENKKNFPQSSRDRARSAPMRTHPNLAPAIAHAGGRLQHRVHPPTLRPHHLATGATAHGLELTV